MNKEILTQWKDIKAEVKDLENRIDKLENQKSKTVLDSVSGSQNTFPYTKCTTTIEGETIQRSNRIKRLKRQLKIAYDDLLEKQTKLEEYIESINNSRIRRILRFRFLDNYSWNKIGFAMDSTADAIRMEYNRFFKEN